MLLHDVYYTASNISKRKFLYKQEPFKMKVLRCLFIVGRWSKANRTKGYTTSIYTKSDAIYWGNPLTWVFVLIGLIVYLIKKS